MKTHYRLELFLGTKAVVPVCVNSSGTSIRFTFLPILCDFNGIILRDFLGDINLCIKMTHNEFVMRGEMWNVIPKGMAVKRRVDI